MRILDLYSGTHSLTKALGPGWEAVTVDLRDADYRVDVLEWDYRSAFEPGEFDVVWASPPCRYFSKLRSSNVGRWGMTVESIDRDMREKGLPLLRKTLEILNYLRPSYYVIENPETGAMKDYLRDLSHYTVDYCAYSDWGYRKRTRLWTNVDGFRPLLCAGKGGGAAAPRDKGPRRRPCPNGRVNLSTGRFVHFKETQSATGDREGTTRKERYRVPPALIRQLLDLCAEKLAVTADGAPRGPPPPAYSLPPPRSPGRGD